MSNWRMIARDELGTVRMGADGGVFKGISDTALEIPRNPRKFVRVAGICSETLKSQHPECGEEFK